MTDSNGRWVLPEPDLAATAAESIGLDKYGKFDDAASRDEAIRFAMNTRSFKLSQLRAREENAAGQTMGDVTSIFKLYG